MSFISTIVKWHEKLFQNGLFTQKATSLTVTFAIILGIIATYMNFQARQINWHLWEQNKEEFFYKDTPLFTTMDAGYFLGIAGYLKSGKTMDEYQSLRVFPKNQINEKQQNSSKLSAPLLSKLIAYFAKDTTPQALLTVGNKMLPYTAAITAIAIFLAFGVTGYWMEGSVAAAGGGLSIAYYWRSAIGRIDTDQLNLGMMYFMFAMVLCAGKSKQLKWGLLFILLAALSARLFMAWYGKSELIIMASICLCWLLIINTRDWRVVIGCLFVFILVSGVEVINPFDSDYLKTNLISHEFIFNNVLSTVTEVSKTSFSEILYRMTGSVFVGSFCLFGMIFWAIRHPSLAVAYAPLAGFAIFSVVLGNRALFYSAPFFWFGGAYIVVLATKSIAFLFLSRFEDSRQIVSTLASSVACSILLVFIWIQGPVNQLAKPSIPSPIIKAMAELKFIAGQEKSVLASWWDYGYASMLMNGIPTFTDPGTHLSNSNYFIADVLLSNNQNYSADTLRFLARGGLINLKTPIKNRAELTKIMFSERNKEAPAVYLMLTNQMTDWMPSISKIGRWDIDLGIPILAKGHKPGQQLAYNFLNCVDTEIPGIFRCNNTIIDLKEGKINGNAVLNLVAEAHGGKLNGSRVFHQNQLNMFQIMKDENGKSAKVAILHKDLFFSTFNQMFHLGRFDSKNFKLVYDGYPHVRIFKLLPVSK